MKKRFKKIYIEITNICNLSCPFCVPDYRKKEFMTQDKFEEIIRKIKGDTDYIYLHVKGEPLIHPKINELIEIAYQNGIQVNITTNGTCLENLSNHNVRQINYSMQSTNDVKQVQKAIQQLKRFIQGTDIYVSLRLWSDESKNNSELQIMLKEEFGNRVCLENKKCLEGNMFLSVEDEFDWPDLGSKQKEKSGYCHGLKDHIAILVDGSVVPCCLDHQANMVLGNIFEQELQEILKSERAIQILKGFQNRLAVEELCQKCRFKNKF